MAGKRNLKAKIRLAVRRALGSLHSDTCPVDALGRGVIDPLRILCRLQKAHMMEKTFSAVARPMVAATKYAMSIG